MTTHSTLPPSPGAVITGDGRTATIRHPYLAEMVDRTKQVPAPYRGYEPNTKCWTISSPDGKWARWIVQQLQEFFPHVEIIRETHDYAEGPEPELASDYARFYLLPIAPPIVVRASCRALSQELHPDKGGSHLQMVALNASYERLQQAGAA